MQKLADKHNVPVIRICGIAEHGIGEVDHVGGIAKTIILREVANRITFCNARDIVENLFQVMVFKTSSSTIFAAVQFNNTYMDSGYGSCNLFRKYDLRKKELKKTSSRSDVLYKVNQSVSVSDIIVPG